MTAKQFFIGQRVGWISSNTRKTGVITHIVPPGSTPLLQGINAGGGGMPRGHESYIVRGQKLGRFQKPYGSKANYWPLVSLLEAEA